MPTRISEALGIEQELLREKGVFDSLLDFDSRLHIDPALVQTSGLKEFSGAKEAIIKYFKDILRLLKASKKFNDIFWNTALKKISTGEGLQTSLGYSKDGNKGSGIGPEIGERILESVKLIQDAGNDDPLIFELVGIFESNVGPDRISDWISFIIRDNLCNYTTRVASELNIPLHIFKIFGKEYPLPLNNITGGYLIFIPENILNDLPLAESWDDVEIISNYNEEVRNKINKILGVSFKEAAKVKKDIIKEMFVDNPDLVKDILQAYYKRKRDSYDFKVDHIGELLWDILGYDEADKAKLDLSAFKNLKVEQVFSVAVSICNQFKLLMENNGLVEHIYDSNGKRRPERFPQLLLFAVADSYCNANNLDLSREPNAGSGALNFKFSEGLAKVTCEVKYSSNGKLMEGFEKQLTAYNLAERVKNHNSIYLIIKVNDKSDHKISIIQNLISERNNKNLDCPFLIVIDGVKQPPASHR